MPARHHDRSVCRRDVGFLMTLRPTSSSVAAQCSGTFIQTFVCASVDRWDVRTAGPPEAAARLHLGCGSFARVLLQPGCRVLPRLRLERRRLLSDWDGGGGVAKLKSRGSCTAVPLHGHRI